MSEEKEKLVREDLQKSFTHKNPAPTTHPPLSHDSDASGNPPVVHAPVTEKFLANAMTALQAGIVREPKDNKD